MTSACTWSNVSEGYRRSFATLCAGPVPTLLDHVAPGGPATYDAGSFRAAMSVQYLVWAFGLAMMWRSRRRTHAVVLADDAYAHLRAGVPSRRRRTGA